MGKHLRYLISKRAIPAVDFAAISSLESSLVIESRTYFQRSLFSFEAKRLGKLGKQREKEYLVGRFKNGRYKKCGGVERFKQGIHGGNLKYEALVGYVQENDFLYWHDLIGSWIEDLISGKSYSPVAWQQKDKLIQEYIRFNTAKFISVNTREKESITLFHLWTKLN